MMYNSGPTAIKILSTVNFSFFAVLVDVPAASMKKAAIAKPAEIAAILAAWPKFTFTASTETRQISGFNCKKVVATDSKTNKAYDVWITNDVAVSPGAVAPYYAGIGGFPVQFTSFGGDGHLSDVTVTGIKTQKRLPEFMALLPILKRSRWTTLKR